MESETHETLSHHSSDGDLSMQYSSSPFESDRSSSVSADMPDTVEPYMYEPEAIIDNDPPSVSSSDDSTSLRFGNNDW